MLGATRAYRNWQVIFRTPYFFGFATDSNETSCIHWFPYDKLSGLVYFLFKWKYKSGETWHRQKGGILFFTAAHEQARRSSLLNIRCTSYDVSRNSPTLLVEGFDKYLLTNVRCYEVLSKGFATFWFIYNINRTTHDGVI